MGFTGWQVVHTKTRARTVSLQLKLEEVEGRALTVRRVDLTGSLGWLGRRCMTVAFRRPRDLRKKLGFVSFLQCGKEGRCMIE